MRNPHIIKSTLITLFSICYSQLINYNLDLVHLITFENASNNYGVSDVWGYTDEEGNEYAIVGYFNGTSIYNVSEIPPIEVGNFIGPSTGDYYYHRDYKTYMDHLYIVNEMYGGDTGMQVIDLSPLPQGAPIQLTTYNDIAQSHNLWIDPSGFAFIEHYAGDNIQIANLNNPSNPIYEGTFGDLASNCHDIYTANGIAYVSEGWSNQFGIYDITNLDNIVHLATIPCEGYAHNAWATDDANILVTTEETENKTIKIWDISDFNNIYLLGEYLGENNLAHNVHIKDNLVYISHYTTGLKIIDIFDPTYPVEVAAYDTYPQNDSGGYYGCWGAYPFTENGYIYASDMQNGLYAFNFDEINAGWVNGNIYFNNTIPLTNASMRAMLNNKVFYSDINGFYNIGFPEGEHTFIINEQDTILIEFLPHETISQNIFIGDELIQGDINQDMVVDILDVIIMVNIVLNNHIPNEEEVWSADFNEDGNINIQDIILIVQNILDN